MTYRCEVRVGWQGDPTAAAAAAAAAAIDSVTIAKQWEDILGRHAAWATMTRGWWLETGLLLLEFKVRTTGEAFKAFTQSADNWQSTLFEDLWTAVKEKEGVERAAFFEWDALDQFPGRRASFGATAAAATATVPAQSHLLRTGNTAL
jgi:hypothetical protein